MILDDIVEYTRGRLTADMDRTPLADVMAAAEDTRAPQDFPFRQALARPGLSFICEIKRASPSAGLISPDFPYLEIAREYAGHGADAVSVLTEPHFFKGSEEYLRRIAGAVHTPVLMKDFVLSEYQIYRARALGASAVLLIPAILSRADLRDCLDLTRSLGLSALVEARSEREVQAAAAAGADIIGINSRDLRTFRIDLEAFGRLAPTVPDGVLKVAESGINSRSDVLAMQEAGADAVLIGSALMGSADRKAKLAELKGIADDTDQTVRTAQA